MKGQLPLSGWGLRSQGVEQFGRSEAFVGDENENYTGVVSAE